MKLKEMTINMSGVFNNFKIEFLESDGPQIHYLVGNNGSGKTLVLNSIYEICTKSRIIKQVEHSLSFALNEGVKNCGIIFKDLSDKNIIPIRGFPRIKQNEAFAFKNGKKSTKDIAYFLPEDQIYDPSTVYEEANSYDEMNSIYIKDNGAALSNKYFGFINGEFTSDELDSEINQIMYDLMLQDSIENEDYLKSSSSFDLLMGVGYSPGNKFEKFIAVFSDELFLETANYYKGLFKDNINRLHKRFIDTSILSSGQRVFLYKVGLIYRGINLVDNNIVIIDEPEIGLHPKWQMKFREVITQSFLWS